MSAELGSPYELLGVKPGVSIAEIKAAYRDLARVWHPDRFAHDERLQKKAQEKLKEINEAYEQLISGKTPRPQRTSTDFCSSSTDSPRRHPGMTSLLLVVAGLIFATGFFVTSRTILRQQLRDQASSEIGQAAPNEPLQSIAVDSQGGIEHRSRKQTEEESRPEEPAAETETPQTVVPFVPTMTTVTVVVDPASGLLAKPDCPVKTKMSYPSGSEPKGHCSIAHPAKTESDTEGAEARVKSIAKRVASPNKWLGGSKEKTTEPVK